MPLLGTYILTAYCHCATCNGQVGQPTASGKMPVVGRTIAAPRNVPFGTRVFIPGLGTRIVEDRTARRYDGRWDLFVSEHKTAQKLGTRKVRIYEVKKGS